MTTQGGRTYLVPLFHDLEAEERIIKRLRLNSFKSFSRQEVGKARAAIAGFMRGDLKLEALRPAEYEISQLSEKKATPATNAQSDSGEMSQVWV